MTTLRRPGASMDPHAGQPVLAAGPPPERADATLLMMHGRGASAEDILSLYPELGLPSVAAQAPQAAGGTWYPLTFLAPLEANQPSLDSALRRLKSLVDDLLALGIRNDSIALLGFSQGACLTLEFAARHPRRYGAVFGLSGGLIGPPGTPREYAGSLEGTPVFLGAVDPDPHIPFERVIETQSVLSRMGADVTLKRYPGMPHAVNEDEIEACRSLLRQVISRSREGSR